MDAIADGSQVADGIASFASALVDIGSVSTSVMQWAAPLALASSIVSLAFLYVQGKGLFYGQKILTQIKNLPSNSLATTVFLKKNAYRLEKHCDLDPEWILKKLEKSEKKEHDEGRIKKLYALMQKRIQQKKPRME